MKFLDSLKKVGSFITKPFVGVYKDLKGGVSTVHDDAKAVVVGGYDLGKTAISGVSTGIQQITSPFGLIAIAAIIGGIYLLSRNK